jgi:glycosyltransferase involved in cell wall biosynthesis
MAKKKILLLSDDLRMSSGVGTMSKEIVYGTVHKYDWVQVGGAIKHPEEGNVADISKEVRKETDVDDANVIVYPVSGYGNEDIIRELLNREIPDAILIYTDPRFWVWLFQIEHELRQQLPIFFYTIWDDLPYPMYNQWFYESCDLKMAISKQTYNIVHNVQVKHPPKEHEVTYVPHGIDENKFYKIDEKHREWKDFLNFKDKIFGGFDSKFTIFYNNRNIRRKMPGDLILAYKTFCDMLPPEDASKCMFLMHTQPVDENGTDLPAVVKAICPEYKVVFSDKKIPPKHLNYLYNLSDICVNIASNEGFGLGTTEALMTGTPITVNVTGGLQDQCGFKLNGKHITHEDYREIHSLHNDRKWANNESLTWGSWCKPVWPSSRALVGSVPTPYIFDDRCRWDDVADRFKEWYDTPDKDRKKAGEDGMKWVKKPEIGMTAKHMCQGFINSMDTAFENWEPRKTFSIFKA